MAAYLNGGDVDTILDCVERAPGNVPGDSNQPRNFVVGCVGTIDFETKGQDLLIDAARRLLGSCPHVDIVFVGAGPDSERLRILSDGLPNIRHIAWTDDIFAQFQKMDVLIQPSRIEGLGSTILEAMSMSLPVVATDVGGIPEIVKNERNGLLVARDSPDDIVAAISRLANDDSLLRRLGTSACRTAQRLNAKTMAEEYYSTYLNVLARVQAKRLTI